MAYKRRYLAGQLAVTVDIADQAVTTDKIGDDAVGPAQLQDDSVNTDKIIDGQVKAEDVGPLAITTEKLQEGAVTSSKIASGAVTSEKLGADVQQSVRPFVPGLPTAEIGDAAITAVKIGAEAVETDKLKDGAVSSDKIAALAITNGKIAPDSIGSDEIVASAIKNSELDNLSVSEGKIINGSVSSDKISPNAITESKILDGAVTEDKILDDAVTEDKILDDAVTTGKLDIAAIGKRHIESRAVRLVDITEDFTKGTLPDRWRSLIDVGGGLSFASLLGLLLQTNAVNTEGVKLDWGGSGYKKFEDTLPVLNVRTGNHPGLINRLYKAVGLFGGATFHCKLDAEDAIGVTPNWFLRCQSGGAESSVDTGVAVSATPQQLTVVWISPGSVKAFIDGIEVAEVTTNIPTNHQYEPQIHLFNRSAAVRSFYLDSVHLAAERVVL